MIRDLNVENPNIFRRVAAWSFNMYHIPGAVPQALAFRAFGAETSLTVGLVPRLRTRNG